MHPKFDSWMSIVDKMWSRPTWSRLLWMTWDFDSPWITGPMTAHPSQLYVIWNAHRHLASSEANFQNKSIIRHALYYRFESTLNVLTQMFADLLWLVEVVQHLGCLLLDGGTVRCRYNAVNFLTNIHERHPIARPLGPAMVCLLWIQHLIDILPQFL